MPHEKDDLYGFAGRSETFMISKIMQRVLSKLTAYLKILWYILFHQHEQR